MSAFNFSHAKPTLYGRLHGEGVRRLQGFKALENAGFDTLSMGTRPSGLLHQGNLFVIASCLHYLRINSKAKVMIDIMDLDFDNQRGPLFTPFVNIHTTRGFREQLEMAVEIISSELKVDPNGASIRFFSEKLAKDESGLRTMFLGLFKSKEHVKALKYALSEKAGRYDTPPISLVCGNCGQSSSDFARYTRQGENYRSSCNNPTCPVDEYTADLSASPFNIHYLVDPARDLLYPAPALHVFGGDYGQLHGASKVPRFGRVAAAMEVFRQHMNLGPGLPSFFITPLVIDDCGNKISKSMGNGGGAKAGLGAYLREEVGKIVRIMGLCIDGTLSGLSLIKTSGEEDADAPER